MRNILVSVGHPFCKNVMQNKAIVSAEEGKEIQAAKAIRKEVAENAGQFGFRDTQGNALTFKPSELYWAIFLNLDDEKPYKHSDNYFWGVLGTELRGEETPRFGTDWYECGYLEAKRGEYTPPKNEENLSEYIRGQGDYTKSRLAAKTVEWRINAGENS